jgi:hypothetical protein
VDVKTLGKLEVVGNNFYPGSAAFSIDGNTLGTAPVNADSTFNTTFTVPQLANGIHTVTVVNNGIAYAFKVRALPTLIGTPDSGPPGTLLQLEAYAFEPNTSYYVYWYGLTFGDYTWYNLINCTTNSEGRFSANLTIPSSYGGSHAIAATSAFYGQNSSSISIYAFASFTMKPTSTVYISFQQSGIDSDATGTVLVVDGTSFSSSQLPIVFSWLSGTAHAFSWASPVSSSMGKRYAWSSTSGLSGDQSGVITTTFSNGSVTASYRVQYLLTTTVSPLSGGTVNPSGINWHDAGVTVQVSAIAASGYIFGNWSGDLNGSLNPSPVLMNEAKNVTANFVQKQNTTITIAASPSSINLGSSITISGGIGAMTPANIVLYQSVNGSSFTIATVMQAVNGSYQYTLTPLSSGAYQFKTFWAGNDQYYSVESAIASVAVASLPAPIDYTIYVILIIIVAIVVVAIIAYTRRK